MSEEILDKKENTKSNNGYDLTKLNKFKTQVMEDFNLECKRGMVKSFV